MLGNKWGARFVALLPSMRNGEQLDWHQDLVYNSMWTLLSSIMNWNRSHPNTRIGSVLMTGLGTGAGGIPLTKCAEQMMLALKHFHQGLPQNLRRRDASVHDAEIVKTIRPNKR
jgi:O-acetyl-ADP-ribose deacetylase (regulator of RNase III)